MSTAPTDADLAAKAGGLKTTETKEGAAGPDPAVVAIYEKAWDDNAGDKDKICAALGLVPEKWGDCCSTDI